VLQCADLGQLIEQNKDAMSTGYDSASKVWTGIEIVAQLELLGLTAAVFANLQANSIHCSHCCWVFCNGDHLLYDGSLLRKVTSCSEDRLTVAAQRRYVQKTCLKRLTLR